MIKLLFFLAGIKDAVRLIMIVYVWSVKIIILLIRKLAYVSMGARSTQINGNALNAGFSISTLTLRVNVSFHVGSMMIKASANSAMTKVVIILILPQILA